MINHSTYVATKVLECTKCKAFTMAAQETEDGAGTARTSNSVEIPSVHSQIMLTILTSQCTSCVAVINILLEFIATMITGVKIEGGDSRAALQRGSKFMAAG